MQAHLARLFQPWPQHVTVPSNLPFCCRYVLNYTVTDSLGLSAVPVQLTVIVYESAQVQASLQLISNIPYTGVAAKVQARINIRQLTDASGSTANTAFRSAI